MCVSGWRAELRGNLASCSVVSSSVCVETHRSVMVGHEHPISFSSGGTSSYSLLLSQEPFATNGEES